MTKFYVVCTVFKTVLLKASVVTIVTDSWTGINGLPVINYVAVAGKKTHFLESVHTGCQSHDAEFLVQDIKRVVNKYNFLQVGAVVTGKTETNKAGWAQLQPDFPRGFFSTAVLVTLCTFSLKTPWPI
ncbi:hypothetical protein PI124_g21217 [Phytophthora idaei]|nr:hypothetical protein PI125_g22464 [Phytophthora idaei]KAG3166580.1 hypothetical protein PI126_g4126 [Phytophthora idaei]KAG3233714.1 hypothetical protein PI124_g21217 [Phytophthora idaei]